MHEKLYGMRKELAGMLKNNWLLKSAVSEVNKADMIKASMIIRSQNHEKIQIEKIMAGELRKDIPVKDYVFIENFCDVVRLANNCLEMGNYLDKNILISAYRILSEDENGYFRRSNPVVYSFNHVPILAVDIEEKLDEALGRIYKREAGDDIILKAMYVHNKIIDIYPFEEYSGELAIFAMNYFLMENGITPISMPIDQQDYFTIVGDCLKGNKQKDFYNFFDRAIYDKMEGTLDACREYLRTRA